MNRLTTVSKLLLTLVITGGIFFGARYFLKGSGMLDKKVNVVEIGRTDNATNSILSSAPLNYQTVELTQLAFPSESETSTPNAAKIIY